MRIVARLVLIALCAAALVTLAGASVGCGGDGGNPGSQWERVTSAQISGDQPVKQNLGDYRLGDRLRLAWVLSGPENPPVTLTLRVFNRKSGSGYGYTVTPESGGQAIAREDDQAILLAVVPGEYRIYFSQRFPPARGPGYDIKLTLYTMRTAP
jgi:hypothetical protein